MAIYRGAGGPGDATTDAANEATVASNKATEAAASAAAAAASESAAASSASSASSSASAASSSATAAASSASSASSSASSASSSATAAANSAIAAAASQVAAETAETNAAASEAAAAASETAAAASETAAASSASSASSSATSASSSATSASGSATAAAASALAAASSESHAASSEAAAATSESNAASSATNAASSATAAAGSATNAANSASAAATSATNASNSASAASTSASNAATSATAAQAAQAAAEDIFDQFGDQYLGAKASDPTTDNDGDPLNSGDIYWNTTNNTLRFYNGTAWVAPETVATTAATNASNSASAAATSATNAANSATAASTSASNASTSESNASTYASNASTSASNAATSATNASNSASAAATSATNAANSATSASSSATSAASSAAAAAASYDSFDDRYLGAKSSAPSTDNDGNALLTGALYYNTTASQLYIWNGSAWDPAAFSAAGSVTSFNTRTGAVTLTSTDVTTALGFTPQDSVSALTTSTTFSGDVSGTYNAIVVADDSHNHIIGNVDGLQTALDAKQNAATALTTSTTFGGDVSGTYNAIVVADDSHNHIISNVDGLQTALDAKQPLDADLTAIAGLAGTSGFLKKTAADTWSLDTNTYLTGNQTITLSGDVSGSGTTSITVTVADDSHNHIISNVDGLQAALDAKAPLASPALTGTPTAPTATVGTNTTQVATTAFVNAEIANDAPTKTGGGASGTWGISITGNATTATTATNATNVTLTTSSTASAFKVPFANTTVSTTGNYGLLQDSLAEFTYNPSTNTLTAGTFSGALSGNATTATTLQTARTINGTSFNGSANITVEPYIEDDESTNATRYLVFTDTTTAGYKRLNEDSGLNYNPSTGTLTSTKFVGDGSSLTGIAAGSFPFYKADGTQDKIDLVSNQYLPFFDAAGSAKNIALTI